MTSILRSLVRAGVAAAALASMYALLAAGTPLRAAAADVPLLLQHPTVSRTHIVFSYAGDLWSVERAGGDARRLTSGVGRETDPFFSPDGGAIAFTGEYDGNVDVYVMPATGGAPRRLTWHPGPDEAAGWTPDGKRVLFRTGRTSYHYFTRLFTMPAEGGQAEQLPLPRGVQGTYSPDGGRLAYVPTNQWQAAWKRYRGGQTTPIWIANLADSSIELVPRQNSNDSCPAWLGTSVYFLSDRDGAVTLYAYDTGSKQVRRVVANDGLDVKWATAGPDAIVYERFGELFLFDPSSGRSTPVPVRVTTDLPQARPHYAKVAAKLSAPALSPSGARVAFEARGEVLTVPAEKGDIRNLTRSPGIADRDPAWSADGQRLAWFSDESGEYALHVAGQRGLGEVKTILLGVPPSFFYRPTWSPDGRKIAYIDKRLNVWYVDVASGAPVKIDTDRFDRPDRQVVPNWSPDSRWITYTKVQPNQMSAVFVYSLETRKTTQVTDGMSDALFPAFDKNGKYLYFTASTDVGPRSSWLDMSGINRPVSRTAYLVVLRKALPSPLAPESDDEKTAAEKKAEKEEEADDSEESDEKKETTTAKPDASIGSAATKSAAREVKSAAQAAKAAAADEKPPRVDIDLDPMTQRTLALPVPAENYVGLVAGKAGVFYLLQAPRVLPLDGPTPLEVKRFALKTRKLENILSGASQVSLAAGGEKLLYKKGDDWFIQKSESPVKPGEGALKLADAEVYVDPRAEWRQMFRETWRIERDFLYDPGFHGLDLAAIQKKYARWLDGLGSRADLTYLFEEMLGELTVGHMFVGGGDNGPEPPKVKGGLLGADYTVESGRYRFARVFDGESWNPELRAPLTQPGVNVTSGEYLLAVNGRELRPPESVYAPFESTAGKSVIIRVGPNADGRGARDVTVVPLDDEYGLRNLAWIEGNRRKVDELSGGKLAYVYLPDTGGGGYRNFNRYFFAQVGKQGVVLDERFNGGGLLADYIIDALRRPLMSYVSTREGEAMASPAAAIYGPKVMIINESAGSGGDAMPWYFRRAGIGKLVGTRTWGGLVGIWNYPTLIDGGGVTAPRGAIYGLKGEWEVENTGISPDIEVELDPKLAREGRDPQLERAVQVAMEELSKTPLPTHPRPPYPKYHQTVNR